MRRPCIPLLVGLCALYGSACPPRAAFAELLLYEPFSYTVGENLGGVDADPDPLGPPGMPVGQTGAYAGGGSYTWYARGTANNYQSDKDAVISLGNLSYTGLATSQGNSVSYGSALPNDGLDPNAVNNLFNKSLYGDSIALPTSVTSGSLYASFIIRIKSDVENGNGGPDRHSPVAFVSDLTDNPNGSIMTAQNNTTSAGAFWMRRDPVDVTLTTSNFSPGKSSGDGIGPGTAAAGTNAGWQNSGLGTTVEANQFGDLDGQPDPVHADPSTWQTYFVVLKYEFDSLLSNMNEFDAPGSTPTAVGQNDTVSLWMNPGVGTLGVFNGETLASQAASGAVGSYFAAVDAYGGSTSDMDAINSFALIGHRQATPETIAVDIDELRIGTTWADVTPAAAVEDADFDGDGDVDGADFLTWQRGLGAAGDLADGDADGDGQVDGDDLVLWRDQFGPGAAIAAATTIPEPSCLVLAVVSLALAARVGSRRTKNSVPLHH